MIREKKDLIYEARLKKINALPSGNQEYDKNLQIFSSNIRRL